MSFGSQSGLSCAARRLYTSRLCTLLLKVSVTTIMSVVLLASAMAAVSAGTMYQPGSRAFSQALSTDYLMSCPDVSTPDLTSLTTYPSTSGVPVSIPVDSTALNGLGVFSADFTFNYDPTVLDPSTGNITVTAGTVLSPSAVVTINKNIGGAIVVSIYDTVAFTGAGTIVNINMRTIGPLRSTSPLTLTNFRFNNTLVCSNVTSGTLSVASGTVSGKVIYENTETANYPVPSVTVAAPGSPNVSGTSDINGDYSLSAFGPGTYTVTPTRSAMVFTSSDGIQSDDPGLIAQHVVGLISLTASQQKAAKVSELPALSSFEAALIAQWIVGIDNPINHTGTWKFTPVSRTYSDVNANHSGQDYTAILMGDVNGSWVTSLTRPARPANVKPTNEAVRASLPFIDADPHSLVSLPFRIDNLLGKGVTSYQFDVEYDPSVIQPRQDAADLAGTIDQNLSVVSNSPVPGLLKVVVYGATPVSSDGVYLNLNFKVVGGADSASALVLNKFSFNGGDQEVTAESGRISVSEGINNGVVRGRVVSALGKPLSRMHVVLTSTKGERFETVTSSFGYYEFNALVIGETYTLNVESKRYRFVPITLSIIEDLADLDVIAEP